MFYNFKNHTIIKDLPLNGYLANGALVQRLDLADFETIKKCGFLPIVSDTPAQPENSIEDLTKRIVTLEYDGVYISRTWIPAPSINPEVPYSVSPRQIRLWLIENGFSLSDIDNAINSINDQLLREKTKIEWEFSPYIERNHIMINTIGSILGLNSVEIDNAFIQAYHL